MEEHANEKGQEAGARTSENGPSRPRRLIFWLLLLASVVILPVVALELLLRMAFREEEVNRNYWGIGAFEPSPELGYRHARNYSGFAVRRGVFDIHVEINDLGLRQRDYRDELGYPDLLLILGDSFAFGLGVEEEAAFPTLLSGALHPHGIGVINGAQTGYSVEQESRLGIQLIAELDPDYILLCIFPANDVEADFYREYDFIDVTYGYRLHKNRWLKDGATDYLRTHSYLWMFVESSYSWKRLQSFMSPRRFSCRGPKFQQCYAGRETEVVQSSLDAVFELQESVGLDRLLLVAVITQIERGSVFDAVVAQAIQEEGIPTLNLGDQGFTREHHFIGDGHWNMLGHQKAAEVIQGFLLQTLEVRK